MRHVHVARSAISTVRTVPARRSFFIEIGTCVWLEAAFAQWQLPARRGHRAFTKVGAIHGMASITSSRRSYQHRSRVEETGLDDLGSARGVQLRLDLRSLATSIVTCGWAFNQLSRRCHMESVKSATLSPRRPTLMRRPKSPGRTGPKAPNRQARSKTRTFSPPVSRS